MDKRKEKEIQHQESMWKGAPESGFLKAKELRNNMTLPEKLLWEELKDNKFLGYKFRRQHPIGIYIVDFYAHKLKLVIEVDGQYHEKPEQENLDKERTIFIEFNGLKVIRFTNEEVLVHVKTVIQKIKNEIDLIEKLAIE